MLWQLIKIVLLLLALVFITRVDERIHARNNASFGHAPIENSPLMLEGSAGDARIRPSR